MKTFYTYEQALKAVQVQFASAAKYEDFVKTKPTKNHILRLLGVKSRSILREPMFRSQKKKRMIIRRNPKHLK